MAIREGRRKANLGIREQILQAAGELFANEGYDRASMRRIAKMAGYSATTIYLHFESKEGLLRSLCEETFAKLIHQFESIGRSAGDPVNKLRAAGRAYVEFGLTHPNHYRVTFTVAESSKPEAQGNLRVSAGERCFKSLQTMLAECVTSRSFREADLDATSQALWALMHGLTSLLIVRPDFAWCGRDNLVDGLLDTVSEGLRA
jgi:AcrR family transcriptional regulator